MTVKQAQRQTLRFMQRTGFLVSWVEIRQACRTDGVIWRQGQKFEVIQRIVLEKV